MTKIKTARTAEGEKFYYLGHTQAVVDDNGNNIEDLLAEQEEKIELLNDNTGVSDYPEFSTSKTYKTGTIVRHEGALFKFTSDHEPGIWDLEEVKSWSINAESQEKLTELGQEAVKKSFVLQEEVGLQSVTLTKGNSSKTNQYKVDKGSYAFKFSIPSTSDKTIYIQIKDESETLLLNDNIASGKLLLEKTIELPKGVISINIAHYGSETDGVVVSTQVSYGGNFIAAIREVRANIETNAENIADVSNDVDKIKGKVLDDTKIVYTQESFTNGFYYKTNVLGKLPSPQSMDVWSYVIINVKHNETWIVSVLGGDNARAWAVLDQDNNIISFCEDNGGYSQRSVTIPQEGVKLLVQTSGFKYDTYVERLAKESVLSELTRKVEEVDSLFYFSGNIYNGEYRSGFIVSSSGVIQTSSSYPNATMSEKMPIEGGKVYCIDGRDETLAIACYDEQGKIIKVLSADTGVEYSNWYLPSPDGLNDAINGQFRTPESAVEIIFGITLSKAMTDEKNRVVLELVGDGYNENFTPSKFDGFGTKKVLKKEHLPNNLPTYLPLKGKTIAFIGDSAIQVGNYEMTELCSSLLGAKEHYNYANGGYTWRNNIENGEYKTCCKVLVDRMIDGGKIPDVIMFQIGGNDLYYLSELGSLDAAFSQYNYKSLAQDTTIYGGIRYNLQRTMDLFPKSKIVVGTVFQRRGNDASKIATPVREVCAKLGIPVIDGNLYSGMSQYMELSSPVYSDNPDGSNKGSREYPQYMWVEPDGTIASFASKSSNAVKVYGQYTYDGTHRTLTGDYHIAQWMASQISSVYGLAFAKVE